MSPLIIRKATKDDIPLCITSRKAALKSIFPEILEEDLAPIMAHTLNYYKDNDNHITYLAFDENKFIACGSICFYQVMPSLQSPTGEKAYIINMYTDPNYRKRGLSSQILDHLVDEAKARNVQAIHLDATVMGTPVYMKYGFVSSESEMHLPL